MLTLMFVIGILTGLFIAILISCFVFYVNHKQIDHIIRLIVELILLLIIIISCLLVFHPDLKQKIIKDFTITQIK